MRPKVGETGIHLTIGRIGSGTTLRILRGYFVATLAVLDTFGWGERKNDFLNSNVRRPDLRRMPLIELHPLEATPDLQNFLPADGLLLQRVGKLSDEQADEVANFEQDLKDYGDLWRNLEPIQRREAERELQKIIARLRSLDVSVSLGTHAINLRPQPGGPSMRLSILYVAAVPGKTALRFLAREKVVPVSFA